MKYKTDHMLRQKLIKRINKYEEEHKKKRKKFNNEK